MNTCRLLTALCRLPMAFVLTAMLLSSQLVAEDTTSLRVIFYSHEAMEEAPLLKKLNQNSGTLGKIEYIRKMHACGHVLRLVSSNKQSLNNMMQTIKQMPLTRLLEADSIIKIQ